MIDELKHATMVQKNYAARWQAFKDPREVIKKLNKESNVLLKELNSPEIDFNKVKMELGDIIFAAVALSNTIGIDPSEALKVTSTKFTNRMTKLDLELSKQGFELENAPPIIIWETYDKVKHSETE